MFSQQFYIEKIALYDFRGGLDPILIIDNYRNQENYEALINHISSSINLPQPPEDFNFEQASPRLITLDTYPSYVEWVVSFDEKGIFAIFQQISTEYCHPTEYPPESFDLNGIYSVMTKNPYFYGQPAPYYYLSVSPELQPDWRRLEPINIEKQLGIKLFKNGLRTGDEKIHQVYDRDLHKTEYLNFVRSHQSQN